MADEPKVVGLQTERLKTQKLGQGEPSVQAQAPTERQVVVLLYHRDGVQAVHLTEQSRVVVGRDLPADLVLRDGSLSRQHAALSMIRGEVWVQDLGSTNGTWVDRHQVSFSKIGPGQEIRMGAVVAAVHAVGAADTSTEVLEGHDRFQVELGMEIARAQTFGRTAALLMIRGDSRESGGIGRWFPSIRSRLRAFDRIALYSVGTAEALLVEANEAYARQIAEACAASGHRLTCGVAVYPDDGQTADGLMEAARNALQSASASAPVQVAGNRPVEPAPASRARACGPAMQEVHDVVARVASSIIPVLLLGETGVGKEVIARAIHASGKRKDAPMVCVNCASIPSQLIESTLFGHMKGSFTGATGNATGVFESADKGTVLLDEVGELPPPAQAALLRVLETKRITRVGSNREVEVDVRVVAATHRDLEQMVAEGRFREDLLYRLNAIIIRIPPLRDRTEEIESLALTFMDQANQANGCNVGGIEPDAMQRLMSYAWPGNVRELRNAMERAVVIARGPRIMLDDLPERVRNPVLAAQAASRSTTAPQPAVKPQPVEVAEQASVDQSPVDLRAQLRKQEADMILEALRKSGWDRSKAAASLGLPLRTLANKMKQHGIRRSFHVEGAEDDDE